MSAQNNETFEYENVFLSSVGEKSYLNEKYADFYFVFESDGGFIERIPAHKTILAASDLFEAMIIGTWEEKNEATIGGVSIGAFKEFLQFFYLARVKLTRENVGDVMKLGNMYNVAECVKACEAFFIHTMTDENVCKAYEHAVIFERAGLIKCCEVIISTNTKAVIKSDAFLQCNRKTLSRVLKMDSLRCAEVDLFEACLAWVKSSSKQDQLSLEILKEYLGDAFCHIRFALMSLQEFLTISSANNIFTFDEYKEIVQMISVVEYQPQIFSTNRRKRFEMIPYNNESEIGYRDIFSQRCSKPFFIKKTETTMFSTNKPILLQSLICEELSLYRGRDANAPYHVLGDDIPSEIKIFEIFDLLKPDEEVMIYEGKVDLKNDDETNINISNPILIRPGFFYEVRMKQSPPSNCCVGFALKPILIFEPYDIKIEFHNDSTVDGINRGLICGMDVIPI